MEKDVLLRFIDRILKSQNTEKIRHSLEQLIYILENQGTDEKLVDLIIVMMDALPEMRELSDTILPVTYRDIEVGLKRAEERMRREEEARRMGRC